MPQQNVADYAKASDYYFRLQHSIHIPIRLPGCFGLLKWKNSVTVVSALTSEHCDTPVSTMMTLWLIVEPCFSVFSFTWFPSNRKKLKGLSKKTKSWKQKIKVWRHSWRLLWTHAASIQSKQVTKELTPMSWRNGQTSCELPQTFAIKYSRTWIS